MTTSSFNAHSPAFRTSKAKSLGMLTLAGILTMLASPAAHAADERFELRVIGQKLTVGKTQTVQVKLSADTPWHMNLDYPTSLKLGENNALELGKRKFRKGDASVLSEHKIVFSVPVTATSPGVHRVQGKIKFAICKADSCSPASAKVDLRINAVAPAATKVTSKTTSQTTSKTKPKKSTKPSKPTTKRKRKGKTRKTLAAQKQEALPSCTPRTPGAKGSAKAPLCPVPRPLAIGYLSRWMIDPILGNGMSQRFFSYLTPLQGD